MPRDAIPKLQVRMTINLALLVPLLVLTLVDRLSLIPSLWLALPFAELALTLGLCRVDRAIFRAAGRELRRRTPGTHFLAALSVGLLLAYGIGQLLTALLHLLRGQAAADPVCLFGTTGATLAVSTAAQLARAQTQMRWSAPIPNPYRLLPRTAHRKEDDESVTVETHELNVGDLIVILPGETVPADGTVTEGISSVNEAPLMGPGRYIDKFPGSTVLAASINRGGTLTCRVERVGRDTTLAQAAGLARQAASTTAPQAKDAQLWRSRTVWAALTLAAVAFVVGLLQQDPAGAVLRAAAVLAAACPAAYLPAVVSAVTAGIALGAQNGIIYRNAAALTQAAQTKEVLLDKEGAITTGAPKVVRILGTRRVPEKFLLSMAAGLSLQSDNPLARAILQRAENDSLSYTAVSDFAADPGRGLQGIVAGKVMAGGRAEFIADFCPLPDDLRRAGEDMDSSGITPLYFSLAGSPAGIIGVSDVVKKSAAPAIAELQAQALGVRLLTPEAPDAARRTAEAIGLADTFVTTECDTAKKLAELAERRAAGPLLFVGDGAAAAEVLQAADIGAAIGAQTADEMACADLVLLRGALTEVPSALRLSQAVCRRIQQNLQLTLIINAALLAAALLCWRPILWLAAPLAAGLSALASVLLPGPAQQLYQLDLRQTDKEVNHG